LEDTVKRPAVLIAAGLFASVIAAPSWAQPVAGRDYLLVQPPQPTNDANSIVVTEFFSYQCPHCFAFAPALKEWVSKLPADTVFELVPVSIGHPTWAPIAKAFYALEMMGKVEELDAAIFRAIHVQRVALVDEAAIVEWVAAQGVDKDAFTSNYDSFSVNAFASRADQTSRAYRIPSVPSLAIDGKYLVPISGNVDFATQFALVDELIDKARAEKAR
jgi:thiol:disulfide interchange protein DsbA